MSEARLSERLQQPFRLRQLITQYGDKIGRAMYKREQLNEELHLTEKIEEIAEASENLEWREQKLKEIKEMLLQELQQTDKFLELIELLVKEVNEDLETKSFCVMFEKDRVTELWRARYLYKSHYYDIRDFLQGKHHLKVTKIDGSTEYLEVHMAPKPSKGLK